MADSNEPLKLWQGLAETWCFVIGQEGSDVDADGLPVVREDLSNADVWFVAAETEGASRLIYLTSIGGGAPISIDGPQGEITVDVSPDDTSDLDLAGAGACGQTPRLDLVWQLIIQRPGDEPRMGDYGDLHVLAAISTDAP